MAIDLWIKIIKTILKIEKKFTFAILGIVHELFIQVAFNW